MNFSTPPLDPEIQKDDFFSHAVVLNLKMKSSHPERGIFMRGKRKRGDAGHRQHEVTCRRRVEQRASRIQRGMQQGGEDWEGDAG